MARKLTLLLCVALLSCVASAQEQPASAQKGVHMTVAVAPMPSLPVGTPMKMKLETAITTFNKAGDLFAGRVTEAIMLDGKTVIPVGASIQGKVVRAEQKRRYKGLPVIEIRPEQVTLPDGQVYTITAVATETKGSGTKVDEEGRIKGSGMDNRDRLEIAGGTAVGAGAGALINGGKGSMIGAALGGGGAVIYWLTKHKTASLPAGTEIIFELDRPMALNLANSD